MKKTTTNRKRCNDNRKILKGEGCVWLTNDKYKYENNKYIYEKKKYKEENKKYK